MTSKRIDLAQKKRKNVIAKNVTTSLLSDSELGTKRIA
jgi:hypothetical protein